MLDIATNLLSFWLLMCVVCIAFLLSIIIQKILAKRKIKKYSLSVPGKIVSYRQESRWVDDDGPSRHQVTYLSVTFDYFYQGVWYRVTKTYNSDISAFGLTDVTAIINPKTMNVDILELVKQNITLSDSKRIALIMLLTVIFGLPIICVPMVFFGILSSFI